MALVTFTCNICSAPNRTDDEQLSREGGACVRCTANVRLRALIHLLSLHLWRESRPVSHWRQNRRILGYGVSDWPGFTTYLSKKIDYRNTQFDRDLPGESPFLDITEPPEELAHTADFVICSEVLEHVVPPVQRAFEGLGHLLKPGGALIFSVPYWFNDTLEHFPELHDWHIEDTGTGRKLVNRTTSGIEQIFTDLCFHGGGSAVLEMRIFGYQDIIDRLKNAGFESVEQAPEHYAEFGIRFPQPWSLPMIARKPQTSKQ